MLREAAERRSSRTQQRPPQASCGIDSGQHEKKRRGLVECPSPAPQQHRHLTDKVLTLSFLPFHAKTWHSRGRPWHKRPSACHPAFFRRRRCSLHNNVRSTPLRMRTDRFVVRRTSRTMTPKPLSAMPLKKWSGLPASTDSFPGRRMNPKPRRSRMPPSRLNWLVVRTLRTHPPL